MQNAVKHILFLLFVLILGLGQIIKYAHKEEREALSVRESVLYPDREEEPSQSSFNDISTIPTQISITSQSRILLFRINPLSKYIFNEGRYEDANLLAHIKFMRHQQLFVSAKKRTSGYYIYTLRKIII